MSDPYAEPEASAVNFKALEKIPLIGRFFHRGPKVPVLRLAGVIADASMKRGGISYARVAKLIEKAFEMKRASAVALVINSPGGTPAQAQLIAGMIRELAEEKEISVYAFVEDVAASGGYWLACAADRIYVQETSIVGSIGVISASFGLEDFIDRHGIKRRLYTSGRDKSLLDPFLPEKPEDVSRLKDIQREIHAHFITWVKARRGSKLNGHDDELFQGRFWTGTTAIDMGIVDEIGEVRQVMKEKYGAEVNFVELSPGKKFPFFLRSRAAQFSLADDVITAVENRAEWNRFGY